MRCEKDIYTSLVSEINNNIIILTF